MVWSIIGIWAAVAFIAACGYRELAGHWPTDACDSEFIDFLQCTGFKVYAWPLYGLGYAGAICLWPFLRLLGTVLAIELVTAARLPFMLIRWRAEAARLPRASVHLGGES